MEWKSPQPSQLPLAWNEREWKAIREHWPGLSEAAKLAWAYLWQESNRGREEIRVTGTMVGAAYGRSGDAGLAKLKDLRDAGLLGDEHDGYWWDKGSGWWRLRMPNPFDVGLRIVRANPDEKTQLEFAFLKEDDAAPASEAEDRRILSGFQGADHVASEEAPASAGASSWRTHSEEAPAHPPPLRGSAGASSDPPALPRNAPPSEPSVPLEILQPSTFGKPSEPSGRVTTASASESRGSAGASSDPGASSEEQALVQLYAQKRATIERDQAARERQTEQTNIGAHVARAAAAERFVNPQVQQRRIEERITWLKEVIDDPTMRVQPLAELAREVEYGRIDERKLSAAMRDFVTMRRHGKMDSPVGYFIGIRNRLYRDAGLPIPAKRNPR